MGLIGGGERAGETGVGCARGVEAGELIAGGTGAPEEAASKLPMTMLRPWVSRTVARLSV